MIGTVMYLEKNIDIRKYDKLKAFVKRANVGASSKKSKVFTAAEVKKFLDEEPNEQYFATKVCINSHKHVLELDSSSSKASRDSYIYISV